MKDSTTLKGISLDKNKLDSKTSEFQGKLSFIFNTIKVLLFLSFTESPYARNTEETIKEINTLFIQYEESNTNKTLFEFLLVNLLKPLESKLPKQAFGFKAIIEFIKFLKDQTKFQQFFRNLIALVKQAILLVQKNGSKYDSIKIINEFLDYLNNYSKQLDILKMASSSTKKQEEKIQSNSKIKK